MHKKLKDNIIPFNFLFLNVNVKNPKPAPMM